MVSILHSKNKSKNYSKENNFSLKKLISNRFKHSFKILTKNSFLEKYFIACFVSYIFNEKILKERYWKFLTTEKDISDFIFDENKIFLIRDSLKRINNFISNYKSKILKKKIFENKKKTDDNILYLESEFFNTLKINIKDFNEEELFSKFSDFYLENFILC